MNIIDDVVKNLRNNPVFHMSLASKELFHSNVLAWLLEYQNIDGLADIFAPCDDKGNKLKDFKVLTVLREKSHLDLIIVFLPDNDDFKSYDWTEIEGIFQNSYSENKDFLEKLEKSCRFVVVENKFKSIPSKEQLEKYDEVIEDGICLKVFKVTKKTKISIVLNEKNTTRYLMAPEIALKNFKELQESKWQPVSYDEDILRVLKSKFDTDDFTANFIQYYAKFLENMLELTKDIEKKLEDNKNHAFPDYWQDIFELKKIRIHDFYEKLWFSVLLNKITKITGEDKFDRKGPGYTNACGLLDFKITDDKKHVWRGVQIQQRQLRIELEPQRALKRGDKIYVWKEDPAPALDLNTKIKNYCNSVLEIMKKKPGKENLTFFEKNNKEELHRFGDFKYRYILLEKNNEKISIEKLTEMINYALEAIYETPLDKFNLEAEEKNP